MKSWSGWFADKVKDRRRRRQPSYGGVIVTDDGEVPLNTPEGRRLFNEYVSSVRNGRL